MFKILNQGMEYCANVGKEMMNALMWSSHAASQWDCAVFAVPQKKNKEIMPSQTKVPPKDIK